MGQRWRRFTEKIYQRFKEKPLNPNNIEFQNSDLIEKVEKRAVHIQNILTEIQNMMHIFNNLTIHVKNIFDIDNAEKLDEKDHLHQQIHQIGNATMLLDNGLNIHSCQFLQAWLHDFETIKSENLELYEKRWELDSRWRTVFNLLKAVNSLRAKLDQTDVNTDFMILNEKLNDIEKRLARKEYKYNICRSDVEALEKRVSHKLSDLLEKAESFEFAIKNVYKMLHVASCQAYNAFETGISSINYK